MINLSTISSRRLASSAKLLINRFIGSFSNKKEDKATCVERKKIVNHFKNVFNANIDLFCQGSPHSSLKTNAQLLKNMEYLSIDSPKLHQTIKQTIETKLSQELTPSVALQTLFGLCSCLEGDEGRLLKILSEYFQKFFYLFTQAELQRAEFAFMQSAKHIKLNFNASLEDEVYFKQQKVKMLNHHQTKNILEHMNIKIPSGVNAIYHKDEERITLTFSHLKQHLTILGVQHGDYQGIYKIKEHLLKDKTTRHFILGLPPLKHYQFSDTMNIQDTKKSDNLKSMLFGGNTFSGGDPSLSSPEELLKHFKEMPILTGDMIRFYLEEYILQQKSEYRLNETERIIYSKEDDLARPNEFLSFIYNQLSRDKHLDSKILLADLSIEDEIHQQIDGKTNEEIQAQFDLMKIVNLNEQIDYAIRVGQTGCCQCGDGIRRGPYDVVSASSESDYNFKIREKNLAKQALNFMKVNQDADRFFMIIDDGHLVNVLKEIINEYQLNEKDYRENRKQGQNLREWIADINKVKKQYNLNDKLTDAEYLKNFSLYSAYFKTNRLLLPDALRNVQNIANYQSFRNEYLKQLNPDSFIPSNQRWPKQKGQVRCFALKQLNFP